ncbi:MAG TPA: hypothetical protein ENJ95_22835 [Bacteroidetes bacterium]|nr:hypothetical protein [Bacteroidota bacterium]
MENSKLITVLQTFSTSELREFKDFVSSPYFNKNKELVNFYLYLKKIAPAFPPKKIGREHVYQSLFPNKTYDDKHFKYLMSFLLKLAEEFIGIKQYEQAGILGNYHILDACVKRKLHKSYKNLRQKTAAVLEKAPYMDGYFYFQQYLLAEVESKHFASQGIRKISNELQKTADYFDIHYLSQKLKYTCEMLNLQKMLSADYQQNLFDEISIYLQKSKHKEIPIIAVYYQIFLMLTDEKNDGHFEKLIALLERHSGKFPPHERQQLQIHAINFCIRKIRQNEEPYVEKALQLYINGIETGILLEEGILSPFTFKNVIKLGLRLKRFDSTDHFISKYSDKLAPKFRQNAVSYGLADLNYHKGNFETSMMHLRKVGFTDIFFTLSAKTMLLKLYYDNNETEALYSLISSFQIFLSRNKLISNEFRKTYQHFIKLLNQISKTDKPSKLKNISEMIETTEPLTERKWLLEIVGKKTRV